jgi:hypothetical protein
MKTRIWWRVWLGLHLMGVWCLKMAVGFVLVRLAGIWIQSREDVLTFNLLYKDF